MRLREGNMKEHLLHECKRIILQTKAFVGELQDRLWKFLLFWNLARSIIGHKKQRGGRILPDAASDSRIPEASGGVGIGWCDGCEHTYDVVILTKGEQIIFNNTTRGRFRVFLREGEIPQLCPHCWKRLEFDDLAKEFGFSPDRPLVFRHYSQLSTAIPRIPNV